MGDPAGGGPGASDAARDSAEFVAGLIVQATDGGQAPYFASERMGQSAGA